MNDYPAVVAKITDDYMTRVKALLGRLSLDEQEEFLREIRSHIYEAYQSSPGDDEVARILAVLRKFGEPTEVVADRLPANMVRTGTKRNRPLYIIGGILIALFGIPLGFGGVAVLFGVLLTLSAAVAAYYIAAGCVVFAGALLAFAGSICTYQPQLWEKLINMGIVHMDGRVGDWFESLGSSAEGFIFLCMAGVLITIGVVMMWAGQYLIHGIRTLYSMMFDRLRRGLQSIRRRHAASAADPVSAESPVHGVS